MRGLAALIVVFCHIASGFYPAMVVGASTAVRHSGFEKYIISTPLNMFINGSFAVTCFFVLSGFVLSYGYYSRSTDLVAASIKRYFRLAPVVFVSFIASFLLLKLSIYHNTEIATISKSVWLGQFWQVDSNLLEALWNGLVGVFLVPSAASSLNPVLWTIYYELIGSLLVYLILALAGKDSRRAVIYIILMVVLMNTNYVGFVVGLALCDLYINKHIVFNRISILKKGYKFILIIMAFILAGYPAYIGNVADFSVLYKIIAELPEANITKNITYLIASALFIVLILTSHKLQKILEAKPLIFLGKISYSIYVIHLLLLGSFASVTFLFFNSFMPYNYAVLIMTPIYLLLVFIISALLNFYVDRPSIYISKLISNRVLVKK